jgi:TonB family protein
MKFEYLLLIKSKRLYLAWFFLLTLVLSTALSVNAQTTASPQLSLADILIALRSKKVNMDEKNRILADAVRERGITFGLTPEIEKELLNTGAYQVLVDAIKLKSPVVKTVVVSLPKPVATPAPQPVSTPTPSDAAFYQKQAVAHVEKGEFDLAIDDYNKVIEMKPSDASAFISRGNAFSGKKVYDLAINDYNKAIEINPKDSSAYTNRGESFEKMGNVQKALDDYKKASDLDASNERAKTSLQRLQAEQVKLNPAPTMQVKETAVVTDTPKITQPVELGQLNSLALNLAKPLYPELARKSNIQGEVTVKIMLDEEGKVVSAKAVEGPSLLRSAAEDAARRSKFKPSLAGKQAVKATGFITYNFKAI